MNGKRSHCVRSFVWAALLLLWAPASVAQSNAAPPTGCGEVVTIEGLTTTRYALAYATGTRAQADAIALVLLVGGGGHLNLDDNGCACALLGNSLVRSSTALIDSS